MGGVGKLVGWFANVARREYMEENGQGRKVNWLLQIFLGKKLDWTGEWGGRMGGLGL